MEKFWNTSMFYLNMVSTQWLPYLPYSNLYCQRLKRTNDYSTALHCFWGIWHSKPVIFQLRQYDCLDLKAPHRDHNSLACLAVLLAGLANMEGKRTGCGFASFVNSKPFGGFRKYLVNSYLMSDKYLWFLVIYYLYPSFEDDFWRETPAHFS